MDCKVSKIENAYKKHGKKELLNLTKRTSYYCFYYFSA